MANKGARGHEKLGTTFSPLRVSPAPAGSVAEGCILMARTRVT